MQDPETARELGSISARLSAQDRSLEELHDKLDAVTQFMHAHKGGVRMLVMLGSFAGAVGAGLAWAWTTFLGGGHPGGS